MSTYVWLMFLCICMCEYIYELDVLERNKERETVRENVCDRASKRDEQSERESARESTGERKIHTIHRIPLANFMARNFQSVCFSSVN